MELIKVSTGAVCSDISEVEVEVRKGITCSEVLHQLEKELVGADLKGKALPWHLEEEWKGCRRRILPKDLVQAGGVVLPKDLVQAGGVVNLHLCPSKVQRGVSISKVERKNNRKIKISRRLGKSFSTSPCDFISSGVPLKRRQLRCIRNVLKKRSIMLSRKYSSTLLRRLEAGDPLWTPLTPTPLETLLTHFNSLEEENLKSSTEISDMNIRSTRLQTSLDPLHKGSKELSEELTRLQGEVRRRREAREKATPTNLEEMKAERARLLKDLEVKNKLNLVTKSKLEKLKDHLQIQRKVLEERGEEKERVRGWGMESRDAINTTSQGRGVESRDNITMATRETDTPSDIHQNKPQGRGKVPTPFQTPPRKGTPSKKRHARMLEARNRQLVEEEGEALKKHQKHPVNKGLNRREEDHKGLNRKIAKDEIELTKFTSKGQGSMKVAVEKHVQFEAEAIVLNAALEGDTAVMKECIKKLGDCCYSNDKGATCLHNAVCSGNMEVITYLVEQSCDINAQDIDGWTPLHCAVAYSNQLVMQYLVEHGSSLFLATKDGDTPLQVAEEGSGEAECHQYLKDIADGLGVSNNGRVFVLFNRKSKEPGELSIAEGEGLTVLGGRGEKGGEGWWRVENGRGQKGEVPSTYLGMYRRVRDTL